MLLKQLKMYDLFDCKKNSLQFGIEWKLRLNTSIKEQSFFNKRLQI